MALQYFNPKNIRKHKEEHGDTVANTPILNDEEEQFLERIASEVPQETPPPLPARPVVILDNGKQVNGKDAQTALMDGADKIPLSTSPPVDSEGKELVDEKLNKPKEVEEKKKRSFMSYFPAISGRSPKGKDKEQAASDLLAAAEAVKSGDGKEQSKEQEDLTAILDQLNLSAVNNRVFSFSKESQELLEKFKLVLKDIVNGVPTAYDDLEKLLTHSESQLTKMYGSLPPFLQTLIKSLPSKMTATLAPELLAATSEKPRVQASGTSKTGERKKRKSRVPSLKALVSEQGAVATMLRSILSFLKLRFPAFVTGTNVLMSLAVFLLLFVFWYCHKRGKETRLDRERLAAEAASAENSDMDRSLSDLEESDVLEKPAESSETNPEDKRLASPEEITPPLIIHSTPDAPDKPSATVADLPSVLDLPEPAAVPLPEPKGETPLKEGPPEGQQGKQ